MFSLVDFGLLVSISVDVYRLVFYYGVPPDTGGMLAALGLIYVVATNLMGSNVRRKNQPIKGLLALVGFAWGLSDHNFADAATIIVYGLALPVALYGAYIFIKSPFVNK